MWVCVLGYLEVVVVLYKWDRRVIFIFDFLGRLFLGIVRLRGYVKLVECLEYL